MKTNIRNNFIIVILVFAVVCTVGIMATRAFPKKGKVVVNTTDNAGPIVTVYKSPSCGCCGKYAAYLGEKRYNVNIEGVDDMSTVKNKYGVPYELESCHTSKIGEYIVEGHIPEEAIKKLLTERPDIKGIGMAGMPSGSPGMPGVKHSDFVIYEITHEGAKGNVFMTI